MVMRCSLHDLFDCQRGQGPMRSERGREGGPREGLPRRAATATTNMLPRSSASAKRTDGLAQDVSSMEQRLNDLKANMSREKAKRDAARQHNPSGAIWGSARTDVPTDSRYVKEVLRQPAMAATRQTFLNPAPPGGAPAQSRRRQTPPQKADGGTSMSETPIDVASRPIIEPGGLLSGAGAGASKFARAAPAAASVAAAKDFNGFGGGLAGGTRSCFEFNVSASQSFLDADDNDYEDLLGPVDPDPAPPPQQQAPPARSYGGGGASLLDGNFDEDESAASFQEALRAFRGEAPAPAPAPKRASVAASRSSLAPVAESGGGGALLEGNFDEDESAASFQEALRAFRGEAPAPAPARKSRFQLAQPAASPAASEPTLADKVHALKTELGLPMEMSMVDVVSQANSVVGLQPIGTLADQLGRLLRECGVKARRGQAGGGADGGGGGSSGGGGAGSGPASPSAGGKASFGTSTAVDVGDGSRPGSARSSSVGGTQTAAPKSNYERFLEQKRKDGVPDGPVADASARPSSAAAAARARAARERFFEQKKKEREMLEQQQQQEA